MRMQQLSVFMENREGRLGEVIGVLKKNDINMLSLSLADSSDYGVLRLLVDEPEKAKDALKAEGFSAKLTEVIGIKVGNKVGALNDVMEKILAQHINIDYMYALATDATDASIVIKTADADKLEAIIE